MRRTAGSSSTNRIVRFATGPAGGASGTGVWRRGASAGAAGRSTRNAAPVVPAPSADGRCTVMRPPCASTIEYVIDKPSPVP